MKLRSKLFRSLFVALFFTAVMIFVTTGCGGGGNFFDNVEYKTNTAIESSAVSFNRGSPGLDYDQNYEYIEEVDVVANDFLNDTSSDMSSGIPVSDPNRKSYIPRN